ncbi:transposase [Lysobacter sp. BMK333-48F3]|uniref:transposase n=1 Tax=Lysobacter sp. BMK333-48F3 TaxID=2867962 RepID=UPI001C8B8B68|nr:transposase [Lysobacter sp. BMK333-48F3]MBX9400886.1 transposase [Lysobacter sp. BMK333-48F3]
MISSQDWSNISQALPSNLAARARNHPKKYRGFIEAVLWVACNRAFWSELPKTYGPWRSIYLRYTRWVKAGIWGAIDRSLGPENACGSALKSLLEEHLFAQQRRRLRMERKKPRRARATREKGMLL